jgi:hypothetical protein
MMDRVGLVTIVTEASTPQRVEYETLRLSGEPL